MKRFASDRAERERLLEITSPLPCTALTEVKRILGETEPLDSGCHVRASSPFHSMFSLNELSDARMSLADGLWGFVNG